MKKLLIAAILVAGLVSGSAQGLINVLNTGGTVGFDANSVAPGPGDGREHAAPAGTPVELWAGPTGGSLEFVGTFDVLAAGFINGGEVAIPGVAGGAVADVQLRLNNVDVGFVTDPHPQAVAYVGASSVSQVTLKEPGALLPAPGLGTGEFDGLAVIPEPSTIALGALGAAMLFFRRRK